MTPRRLVLFSAFIAVILLASVQRSFGQEIVLYASQPSVKVGNWYTVADATAAGGTRLTNPDLGAAKITTPAITPSSYVELIFQASAGKPYRIIQIIQVDS